MNENPWERDPENPNGSPEKKPVEERPVPDRERQEVGAPAPTPTSAPYAYRWSYEAQSAYDRKESKRRQGKGTAVYAIVMSVAFLLCLSVLIVTLVLNGVFSGSSGLTTAEVAERVNPGTVLIYASGSTQSGYGTGFFIRSDGYIVTNYHVIESARTISVTLYSGAVREASAVWYSWADDLAILKIEGSGYPTLTIGNSDALQVGDTAIAVGNPAGNLAPWTTTQGIISAVDRVISVEENTAIVDMVMLQTDAQVNPGNSGGPLCNDRGEVIGIVTRKMSEYEGLGLAIPINEAMELINAYLTTGSTDHVTSKDSRVRPTMGIQAADIKEGDQILQNDPYVAPRDGVLVVGVTPGGAAEGILEPGDIILQMGGSDVFTLDQLRTKLYTYSSGQTVEIVVDRFGEQLTLQLRLGTARAS